MIDLWSLTFSLWPIIQYQTNTRHICLARKGLRMDGNGSECPNSCFSLRFFRICDVHKPLKDLCYVAGRTRLLYYTVIFYSVVPLIYKNPCIQNRAPNGMGLIRYLMGHQVSFFKRKKTKNCKISPWKYENISGNE